MAVLLSLYFSCMSLSVHMIPACGPAVKACYDGLTSEQKASKPLAYEACKQVFE